MTLDSETILNFKNVSKKFTYSLRSARRYGMRKLLRGSVGLASDDSTLRPEEFWAVRNASFTLKRGETLGLIGPNGAGKSTMLKMINGLFLPDVGEIRIKGKVGALIELGTGFHPYLSGRENIIVKGALMGKSKEEIEALFDEIVEFSELGDFIDSPVRNYSSGMFVRLGFSVAAHINPDILLMDEILAVGDFKFKTKSLAKINEIREMMSVIFISHNMMDVARFCDRVIVLDKGETKFEGKPNNAIDFYLNRFESKDIIQEEAELDHRGRTKSFYGEVYHNKDKIVDVKHTWIDSNGKKLGSINHNDTIILDFSFRLLNRIKKLVIGVPIWDSKGNYITSINSDLSGVKVKVSKEGFVKGSLTIENTVFNPGDYISVISVSNGPEIIYRGLLNRFVVEEIPFYFGFITLNGKWNFSDK